MVLGTRFYLGNVDLTPPPLAAPAAKLRQEEIDSLIKSFSDAPSPCIIGGTIPASIKMPTGLSHDLAIGQTPIARFFLSRGWPAPQMLDAKSDGIDYTTLIFKP